MADHPTTVDSTQNPATDLVASAADARQSAQLTVEQHFAVVPEWMIDAGVSDVAFRLYAVLARYGNTSGVRMPGRSLLARRLRKSVDTVDRALRELVAADVLEVERRQDGNRHLTNRYHLRTVDPAGGRTGAAIPSSADQASSVGSRSPAATPRRTSAARVAAPTRPDPEIPTETPPPTPVVEPERLPVEEDPNVKLVAACGIPDLDAFATQVQRRRRDLGQPSARWAGPCLMAALQLAVKVRGWPASAARQALLLVAADSRTRSPMRLAEAGPWWDHAEKQILRRTAQEEAELDGLERLLADCDDRALLQREARSQLDAEGSPPNRLTVARRAARLLERETSRSANSEADPALENRPISSAATTVRRSA